MNDKERKDTAAYMDTAERIFQMQRLEIELGRQDSKFWRATAYMLLATTIFMPVAVFFGMQNTTPGFALGMMFLLLVVVAVVVWGRYTRRLFHSDDE
jgi:hypothetical protein